MPAGEGFIKAAKAIDEHPRQRGQWMSEVHNK
jgi:hypothetical protein